MPPFLAYAESFDTTYTNLRFVVLASLWFIAIAALVCIPFGIVLARHHRHRALIAAASLLLGFVAACTAFYVLWAADKWAHEQTLLLQSGYYDPREHPNDAPTQPWLFWFILAAGYVSLIAWSSFGAKSSGLAPPDSN